MSKLLKQAIVSPVRKLMLQFRLPKYRKTTRQAFIPIVKCTLVPDRTIHRGIHAGKGCYYKTALLNTLIQLKPKTCLEIGTHYGGTTEVFLRYFRRYQPDGVLITTDIKKYVELSGPRVRQVIVYPHIENIADWHTVEWDEMLPEAREILKKSNAENIAILRKELEACGRKGFDFCFIDGDHTRTSFLRDLDIAWTLSLPPHYFLLDDVKEELHDCCPVYRKEIPPNDPHYEFEDWPIFIGQALIWKK